MTRERSPIRNKCETCGGRGLEMFEGGFAGFCRECYGFGAIIDAPVVDFCHFGFFSDKLERAWGQAMDVTGELEQASQCHSCHMIEE